MIEHYIQAGLLKPGTRVRLIAPTAGLQLAADTGSIVSPDQWEDYYIIRLDQPAFYEGEMLWEVREDVDNLEILDGGGGAPVMKLTDYYGKGEVEISIRRP